MKGFFSISRKIIHSNLIQRPDGLQDIDAKGFFGKKLVFQQGLLRSLN